MRTSYLAPSVLQAQESSRSIDIDIQRTALPSACWLAGPLRVRWLWRRIQVLSVPFFERNQCPGVERIIKPTCHQVTTQFRYRVGIEISSALYLLGGEILALQGTRMPSDCGSARGFPRNSVTGVCEQLIRLIEVSTGNRFNAVSQRPQEFMARAIQFLAVGCQKYDRLNSRKH